MQQTQTPAWYTTPLGLILLVILFPITVPYLIFTYKNAQGQALPLSMKMSTTFLVLALSLSSFLIVRGKVITSRAAQQQSPVAQTPIQTTLNPEEWELAKTIFTEYMDAINQTVAPRFTEDTKSITEDTTITEEDKQEALQRLAAWREQQASVIFTSLANQHNISIDEAGRLFSEYLEYVQ